MERQHKPLLWLCASVLSILLLITIVNLSHDGSYTGVLDRRSLAAPVITYNTLSYLYIVGVEGVGHHGVSPAIATIAKTCNKHVLYEMKQLRTDQQKRSTRGIKAQITKLGTTHYSSQDVVIIEDSSFPTGGNFRTGTQVLIKSSGFYDLEWLHNELLVNVPNMKIKYLYLDRDFYRAVASHPEFDKTFEQHAHVLHNFMLHINSEYLLLERKYPDTWRQISYEWFTNMDVYNCTAIVSAVIDFMEWDHCDVEFACQTMNETIRKERRKEIIPEEYEYAQTFNVSLSIPKLDISPNRTYSFNTVVSARTPIVIVSDPGPRRAKRTVKTLISDALGNVTSPLGLLRKTSRPRISSSLRGRVAPTVNGKPASTWNESAFQDEDAVESYAQYSAGNAILNGRAVVNGTRGPNSATLKSIRAAANKRSNIKTALESNPRTNIVYNNNNLNSNANKDLNNEGENDDRGAHGAVPKPGLIRPPARAPIKNDVSILYLVGLQGSDQNTVASALAFMAKSANYHVIQMHPFLSRAHKKLLSMQYKSTLSAFRNSNFVTTSKVLIIFGEAFPLTEELPVPPESPSVKLQSGAYNLMWVLTQAQELGFDVTYLYLQRDFQHTVASVPGAFLERTVEQRVHVLQEYALYIQQEQKKIESKQAGLWAQVRYEWFTEASSSTDNCTTLVASIAHRMGWQGCHMDSTCEHMRSVEFIAPTIEFTDEDNGLIQAGEVTLSIPTLHLLNLTAARDIDTASPAVRRPVAHKPLQTLPRPVRQRPPPVRSVALPPRAVAKSNFVPEDPSQHSAPEAPPAPTVSTAVQTVATTAQSAGSKVLPKHANEVSVLYTLGLLGSDLETVTAALTSIAQAANYRVIVMHPQLLRAQKAMLNMQYKSILSAFKTSNFVTTTKVLILMHGAFPSEVHNAALTIADKRRNGLYNLLWVLTQAQEVGVHVNFLYVQRDAQLVMAGLPLALRQKPLDERVGLVQEYITYLQDEYHRTESKQAGLWAQAQYEWFALPTTTASTSSSAANAGTEESPASTISCANLVAAIVDFVDWGECDKVKACRAVQAINFVTPVMSFTEQEMPLIMSINTTLPMNMLKT